MIIRQNLCLTMYIKWIQYFISRKKGCRIVFATWQSLRLYLGLRWEQIYPIFFLTFSSFSPSGSLFLYSAAQLSLNSLCTLSFLKSLLVHQLPNLPNLAGWASERLQLDGNRLPNPLSLSLSRSLSLCHILVTCPSLHISQDTHAPISRWATSR